MTNSILNMWRSHSLARLAPPGHYSQKWRNLYLFCLALASALSAVSFGVGFYDSYCQLFLKTRKGLILIDGATVAPFWELALIGFLGFLPIAIALIVFGCWLYSCFYSGARSIYLMRRLPDGRELTRRVFSLPLLGLAGELVTAPTLLLLYYVLYLVITPASCLP